MSTLNDYNRFVADVGPGYDAAGRLTFNSPWLMYMGPSEFAATAQALRQSDARTIGEESMAERRQRLILDQLSQYSPPTGYKFDFRMIAPGRDR